MQGCRSMFIDVVSVLYSYVVVQSGNSGQFLLLPFSSADSSSSTTSMEKALEPLKVPFLLEKKQAFSSIRTQLCVDSSA